MTEMTGVKTVCLKAKIRGLEEGDTEEKRIDQAVKIDIMQKFKKITISHRLVLEQKAVAAD